MCKLMFEILFESDEFIQSPYGFLCVNQFMIFDPSLAANEKYSYSLEFKLISKFTDTSGYSYKALHNTVEKLIDPELYFVLHSSGDFVGESLQREMDNQIQRVAKFKLDREAFPFGVPCVSWMRQFCFGA